MWPWIEPPDADDVLVAKARAFADAPEPVGPIAFAREPIDPRTAPLVAQRLCVLEIPLPPGCNSAAHVGWLGEDMGQTTTVEDARTVLRANAFRDWLWFGTHHPLDDAQLEVFTAVVGHRRAPTRAPVLEILDAVAHGRPTREHRDLARRPFPDLGGRPGPAPTEELWAARLADGRRTGRVAADGTVAWGSRGL
ncbi:hypothetical protein [Patulibacter minatonensis]|uniref:hypothetical protein n=1 Tax=Patulibacter minatonensis TaxID=298163 RepID=UPI00047D1EC0|nr:hypothetical protein [Patulibacter minatonensis]